MQFLIVLIMLPVTMVNSRREVSKDLTIRTKTSKSTGNGFSGPVLECGEYHLALSQNFIINSDVAQESTSADCKWKFTVPEKDADIRIHCNVNLASGSRCNDAFLIVFDGGNVKQKYCGKEPNVYQHSATGFLAVTAKIRKKVRNDSGKFECVVNTRLKDIHSVKGEAPPVKQPPTSLPAPLSLFQAIADLFIGEE